MLHPSYKLQMKNTESISTIETQSQQKLQLACPKNELLNCIVTILLQFKLNSIKSELLNHLVAFCFSLRYVPPIIQHYECITTREVQFSYYNIKLFSHWSYDTPTMNQQLCNSGKRNRTQRKIKVALLSYTLLKASVSQLVSHLVQNCVKFLKIPKNFIASWQKV